MAGDAAKHTNPSQALPYFSMACEANQGRGCLEAADISDNLFLYEKACTLGMARGCYTAALKYRKKGMKTESETYLKVGCGMDVTYCDLDAPPPGH